MFRDIRGANDVGIAAGDRLQYGADIVGGSLGVSLGAVAATGFVDVTTPCSPLAVNTGFCANSTAYNAARLNPWQFNFTRGAESLSVTGPTVVGASNVPFPISVTLSGTGLTPTISWQVPNFTPDGFRVNVYDKNNIRQGTGQADIILSTAVAPNATSFTLPGNIGLTTTGNYTIDFQVIETRGHVAFTNNNAQILSRSNSFFAFTPLSGSVSGDVFLPTIAENGVYNFHVGGVGADHITFIDPLVAIGYRFTKGVGDPNFKSVLLPNVGDGVFTLSFADAAGAHSVTLLHDQQFFFGQNGVDDFTVSDIEASAGLDPANATAFITGLTFITDGEFTGTMTPISIEVAAMPEPETYAMMLAGLGLMGFAVRRRKQKAA
jgi:hypothetical protein